MHTDQFNHAPAQLLMHTGNQRLGYASMGSWITYGLGSENENLPGFIVLVSGGKTPDAGKSVWGSGYLPAVYQGVQCRTQGEPVLYVNNPAGINPRAAAHDARCDSRSQHDAARTVGRSRHAFAHRPIRAGVPHADRGARR